MRKGKRAGIQPTAWLFALVVPAAALFVLFSLMPYSAMVSSWPLGIGQQEVMAYQRVFDHRPGQHASGEAGALALTSGSGACDAGTVTVTTATDTADMDVRSLPGSDDGSELSARSPLGLDAMERIAIVPADLTSLERLYAQAVADSLPIANPALTLVRLSMCGKDKGPYLMQAALSPGMILRSAPVGSVLLGANGLPEGGSAAVDPAHQPRLGPDVFDTNATAALGYLACVEQRADLLNGNAGVLYDGITGHTVPLYRMRYGTDTSGASGPVAAALRSALKVPGVQVGIRSFAARFRADSAAWVQRLQRIDSARVPVLANGRNLGLVQASVDRNRERFIQRMFNPGPEIFLGEPVPARPEEKVVLDPWLAQFRSGRDTLRFVRGKYEIDHDLVIPAGYGVVLEKGTRWNIAPGVSITIHGEFHARGTELNPVFIRPMDPAVPYGSIAVIGDGDTRVRLRGVQISGGSEHWENGLRRSGMLTFVLCDATVDKCIVGSSFGGASIEGQRGSATITDSYFAGARHADISLTETKAVLERCGFSGQDAGKADGLVADGAEVWLRGCTFNALSGDAFRLGGGSMAAVLGSTFSMNGTAVRADEGSTVEVDGTTFTGNRTAVHVRGNRLVLGTTKVVLHTNTFTGNGKDQDAEGGSVQQDPSAFDPQRWRAGLSAGR